MVSWMRTTDCISSFVEWHTEIPMTSWTWNDWEGQVVSKTMDWDSMSTQQNSVCCDYCGIGGGNVDVFYWPVSGANSECLTTVGTNLRAIDDGLWITDGRDHLLYKSQSDPYAVEPGSSNLITSSPPAALSPGLQPRLAIPANGSVVANGNKIAIIGNFTL